MGFLRKTWNDLTGVTASEGAERAMQSQLGYQQQGLDYMKGIDRLPLQYRDQAQKQLSDIYMGDMGAQEDMIQRSMSSPLYSSLMSGMDRGLESVAQNAGSRGLSRSGDLAGDLYQFTSDTQNNALLQSYGDQMRGLQGFTNPNLNTANIGTGYNNMGQTSAQGINAQTQAGMAGTNLLMQGIGTGLQMYGAGMFSGGGGGGGVVTDYNPVNTPYMPANYSDIRLKENVKRIDKRNGHNWYSWDWNELASKLGLTGSSEGVVAQEVAESHPEAVSASNGYLKVNYSLLGV